MAVSPAASPQRPAARARDPLGDRAVRPRGRSGRCAPVARAVRNSAAEPATRAADAGAPGDVPPGPARPSGAPRCLFAMHADGFDAGQRRGVGRTTGGMRLAARGPSTARGRHGPGGAFSSLPAHLQGGVPHDGGRILGRRRCGRVFLGARSAARRTALAGRSVAAGHRDRRGRGCLGASRETVTKGWRRVGDRGIP